MVGLTRERDCASDLCRRSDGSIVVRHLYRADVSDMKDGKSEDEDCLMLAGICNYSSGGMID